MGIAAGALLVLAGCGIERPLAFTRPGVSPEQQARDERECRFEAVRAGVTFRPIDFATAGMERQDAEARVFNACMIARDYAPRGMARPASVTSEQR